MDEEINMKFILTCGEQILLNCIPVLFSLGILSVHYGLKFESGFEIGTIPTFASFLVLIFVSHANNCG